MPVELWILSEDCKYVKAGTTFYTFTRSYKYPFRGCSQNNNDNDNKREKNSKNSVKPSIVHETVTAVSHLELAESRQASSQGHLGGENQEWGHKTRIQTRLERASNQ